MTDLTTAKFSTLPFDLNAIVERRAKYGHVEYYTVPDSQYEQPKNANAAPDVDALIAEVERLYWALKEEKALHANTKHNFDMTEKMLSDAVNSNDELSFDNGALEERIKEETKAHQERIAALESWQRKTIMSWFNGWHQQADGTFLAGLEWGGHYYVEQRANLRDKWQWWCVDAAGNEASTSLLYSTREAAQKAAEDDWLKKFAEEPQ